MEALYWGNASGAGWSKGTGEGPWVMADLENGVWAGNHSPITDTNTPVVADFVTAVLKGKAGAFGLKGGDANLGKLKTMFEGIYCPLKCALTWYGEGPRPAGYEVMKKQGAIVLGIGGELFLWRLRQ